MLDIEIFLNYLDSIIIDQFVNKYGNWVKYNPIIGQYQLVQHAPLFRPCEAIGRLMIANCFRLYSIDQSDLSNCRWLRSKVTYSKLVHCNNLTIALRINGNVDVIDLPSGQSKPILLHHIRHITQSSYDKDVVIMIDRFNIWFIRYPDGRVEGVSMVMELNEVIIKVQPGVVITNKNVYIIDHNHNVKAINNLGAIVIDAVPLVRINRVMNQFYLLTSNGVVLIYDPIRKITYPSDIINDYGIINRWSRLTNIGELVLIINDVGNSFIIDCSGLVHQSHIPANMI